MGRKKYYCDFCNRFFNDDKNTRSKHLNSVSHQNLRKEHYSLFRDLSTVYKEESVKKACRKFHTEGFCSFGCACSFSHYTKHDLEAIKQQLQWHEAEKNYTPTINDWLMKYNFDEFSKVQKSRELLWSTLLPPELVVKGPALPPSVLPFHIQEFINTDLEKWGEL